MPLPLITDDSLFPDAPTIAIKQLEAVWFQVGGTICNLRCHHCFISCTPENDKFKFMTLQMCRRFLDQAKELGAKEYYFTGGEPFANPDMIDILELTLSKYGPATVLTNATILTEEKLTRLGQMATANEHHLEIRVSLDGYTRDMNDPIRGPGTFDRAIAGIKALVQHGFQPILTITRTWNDCDEKVLKGFVALLAGIGYAQPRLKILPSIKLGAEVDRTSGYTETDRITHDMMQQKDPAQFLCHTSRLVTDQGVWVCPILLDSTHARMSDSLQGAMHDYPLRHSACYTCWQHGAICSNNTTSCTTANN